MIIKNKVTLYLLPLYDFDTIKYRNYIISAYVTDLSTDIEFEDHIILLAKANTPVSVIYEDAFVAMYDKVIDAIPYKVIILKPTTKDYNYIEDIIKIQTGLYSEISEDAKQKIINCNYNEDYRSILTKVLYKEQSMIDAMYNMLKSPDDTAIYHNNELHSVLSNCELISLISDKTDYLHSINTIKL